MRRKSTDSNPRVSAETPIKIIGSSIPDKHSQREGQPTAARSYYRGCESLPCSSPDIGRALRQEGIPENSACSGKVDDVAGSEMREDLMNSINGECGG